MINVTKYLAMEEIGTYSFNEVLKFYDLRSWKALFTSILENLNKINSDEYEVDINIIEDDSYVSIFISANNSKDIKLQFDKNNDYIISLNYLMWNSGNIYIMDSNNDSDILLLTSLIIYHINNNN
mgnify:CR=1 FL=1